ncbi:arginine decarboxylase, pyruvoyl-dependent [bacterium]|nr:arginine decarboxylase, pyruvoyl-dependent [bacterium]
MNGFLPNLVILSAGSAEGGSELNAFDNALLKAGIANLNLIRVSSILPPRAEITYEVPFIEKGSLVPIVLAKITSCEVGEVISAVVAVGVGEDFGVIMEHSMKGSKEEAEREAKRKVEEAFKAREMALKEVHIVSAEHKVEKLGCAIAAAILWWR